MCLSWKLQFYDLSYKSKNIAIQIVCYSLRSSATMKKQRNIESFEGRNHWAGKVTPSQVCGVHNSRYWFLIFFPARLLCLFRKTKVYGISGVLVSTTIDIYSNGCINLRLHRRIASNVLHTEILKLGYFHQTGNKTVCLATSQRTVLRVKMDTWNGL